MKAMNDMLKIGDLHVLPEQVREYDFSVCA
jgi:hypothetical protein